MVARTGNVNDNQNNSFVNDGNGNVARNVVTSGNGSIIAGISYDTVNITYPTTTTEVFTYILSAVTQATVTVTYSDVTKKDMTSVVKT